MKKIFTTLAAALMVAVSANAAITVTNNEGESLENGAVITLGDSDFHLDEQLLSLGLYQWSAEYAPMVKSSSNVRFYVELTNSLIQFCPTGNCFNPTQDGDKYVIDVDYDELEFAANLHLNYMSETLPQASETAVINITNKEGDSFTYTVNFVTTDSGVDEIMTSSANIAGIYDLQGRRVRDDYRGVAIVVYDNGKAVKQVIK